MVELIHETRPQKVTRKSLNAWNRFVGLCMKSEILALIKATELRIKTRKQSFGEQYMSLLQQGAPAETLERCLFMAQQDIGALEGKITELRLRQERITTKVRSKLRHKPDRWDAEKSRAMEQLMTIVPTEVVEVYFDEGPTDFVAYAFPVGATMTNPPTK